MNLGIIILCRTSSKRLPKKALIKINNITIIEYAIKIAKSIFSDKKIILSTSFQPEDNILENIARNNKIKIYRGDLENVYDRFYKTMEHFKLDFAVRLNADSPLNHPLIIRKAIELLNEFPASDIITNIFPRSYPKGMSAEIISKNILGTNRKNVLNNSDKENITSFFYNNYKRFRIINFSSANSKWKDYNLSIDNINDQRIVSKLIKKFPNYHKSWINFEDIISFYEKLQHQNKYKINQ